MKNVNKATMSIIAIYLIHLLIYIGMSYITLMNMSHWNLVFLKLKINSNIDQYNHLYISVFYLILSTYLMLNSLNFSMHKLITILVYTISYAFAFFALYKYYSIKEFIDILLIANGLVLSLNVLFKKINKSHHLLSLRNFFRTQ
ncbi:hypothetical protein Desor_1758 [Desulfosporosinus orientis DSM 765]|uniref:Uncharacterized protein n=1 Tax=Desulfosporosinus orientis (strain ATCC 19365 / DSM 765 / NCIMB 8382 / VKM B-1628 / Singapore I) TaxID=768706 RepID=G7W621_DESOD|nr:hypothetical protein Desor_1758 [Desulfosporosinus orientis DSM 765]